MPILKNARHEAFAQSRAAGATLDDAYEDAGFVPDRSHASRLAQELGVADRIAELRKDDSRFRAADGHSTIAALIRLTTDEAMMKNPAAMREARQNLLEAHRLRLTLAAVREGDRRNQFVYRDFLK